VLFVAAGIWFATANIREYEVSVEARVESERGAQLLNAPVAGVVVANHLELGKSVHQGDVLVELDAEAERRQLEEAKAKLASLSRETEALSHVIDLEERAKNEDRAAGASAVLEQRAEEREAELDAQLAAAEAERATRMEAGGVVSELERERAKAAAERLAAERKARGFSAERAEEEQRTRDARALADIAKLKREITNLDGQKTALEATTALLSYEIDKRTLRAMVDGKVGEFVASIVPGSYIHEGDALGAIVPDTGLHIVALFAADGAVGRIREGQPARVRLTGFPWADHGVVTAKVTRVADEPRNGQVRVELEVTDVDPRIKIEHGLTGTAEIEVDRATPLAMVLRTLGRAVAPG
jgi:multidrug resistance efflux pump